MTDTEIKLSIRLDLPNGTRFGPGKAILLSEIETHGTVSAAARALGMSYPKALRLIDSMNQQFGRPLIKTFHGGVGRGGAALTATGHIVLHTYRDLCGGAVAATTEKLDLLSNLCRTKNG
ncbi:MAG: LysR family transcriptional regulator [Pseudomonadota bacterium]